MHRERGRVLIVDDDRLNRVLLTGSLADHGYIIETAEGGRAALAQLAARPFDVVLLDLMMPDIDGFTVLERMRHDQRLRHTPVIIVSATEDTASLVRCIEMGATDYLPKPFDPVLLRARVNGALATKRLHDAEVKHLHEVQALVEQLDVRNRFIEGAFGRYLSDELVASLLASPERLRLGGERRKVSILMGDLRGFSPIAERLEPEQVVALLNNFLGVMADVIMSHHGTIEEFQGDAALVMFGAPIWREDDALRAVACAIAMQQAMAEVNDRNRAAGLPIVEMGVAVNTGEVVVGNIGSERRAKYGAVGSHVNLTARLESCTVGGQVVISESTLREAGPHVIVGESRMVRAKGFPAAVRAHDLIGLGGPYRAYVPRTTEPLVDLENPAAVHLTLLDEKHETGEPAVAEIVRLSSREADIRCDTRLPPLTDVKLHGPPAGGPLAPGDHYAKVSFGEHGADGTLRLRFTSTPPRADLPTIPRRPSSRPPPPTRGGEGGDNG